MGFHRLRRTNLMAAPASPKTSFYRPEFLTTSPGNLTIGACFSPNSSSESPNPSPLAAQAIDPKDLFSDES